MSSLLEDFKENTGILNGHDSKIDQAAFDKLVETRGIEFARGYLKALQEFTLAFGRMAHTPLRHFNDGDERYDTQTNIYSKFCHLHVALFEFAEKNELGADTTRPPDYIQHSRAKIFGW